MCLVLTDILPDEREPDHANLMESVECIFVVLVEDEFEVLARHADVNGFQLTRLEPGLDVAVEREVTQSLEQQTRCQRCDKLALAERACWVEVLATRRARHISEELHLPGDLGLVD